MGSSLPTCGFTHLPANWDSCAQPSTRGLSERVVRFSVGFGLGEISQVRWGVLLGHDINMDDKCLIGKIVQSLLPATLLFLEVALLKACFNAVCGLFGCCNKTKYFANVGKGRVSPSQLLRISSWIEALQCWELKASGGLRKQGLWPASQHLM